MWKISHTVEKGDYDYAVVPDHPDATERGYVLHHRVIMENHLDRRLKEDEVVHHINEDTKDNRIENLKVISDSEHRRHHAFTGRKIVRLKCPQCEDTFEKPKNQTHLQKSNDLTFCSRSCSAKFYPKEPHQVKEAISENILEKFVQDNSEVT